MTAETPDRGARARPSARAEVLRVLTEVGAVSRAELARRSGLAASTVSAIVAELGDAGLVVDTPQSARGDGELSMGRPATLVALHRRAGLALGLDFGKRHIRVALADMAHNVLSEASREVSEDLPAREAIAISVELVEEALAETGAEKGAVLGVGMGLPGPIHQDTGEVGDSTILPGWVGVRAADAVSEALGLPVDVGNDANLGALSEWKWGAGRGVSDLVYLKAATGVGAGLILGGAPYLGSGGTAGEFGHTVVDPAGPICRCGNRGCLEMVAGVGAVVAALRAAHGDGLTIGAVLEAARDGDAGCQRAIADAGRAIGVAAGTLCNLLNPERIVVGGTLALAGDLLLAPLRESLPLGAIRSASRDVRVVEGELGDRAEVLGAVALVLGRGAELLQPQLEQSA